VATAPQYEFWEWKPLYESAVLECDLTKLPERIADAQKAIMERLQCLDDSMTEAERNGLLDARNVLCDLCKMAGLPENTRWNAAE
jgi:hypothetical protein